jgi:NAD+ synthase (glutamine-hydrolysing)
MRIALAQIDNTVGDLEANASKILDFARRADVAGAELVVFPELALTGYPPRDLTEKQSFLDRTKDALCKVAMETARFKAALIVGYVAHSREDAPIPAQNAAAVIEHGRIVFDQRKMLLPSYDVFDETRYFEPARSQSICVVQGCRIALTICEDAWNDKQYWERRRYSRDPVEELVRQGADLIVSINASPWNLGKREQRHEIYADRVLTVMNRISPVENLKPAAKILRKPQEFVYAD